MVRNSFPYVLVFGLLLTLASCTKSSDDSSSLVGNWVRTSDFDGAQRTDAVVAVAGNDKAYLGLGFDGTNRLTDFWEYDPVNDFYLRKKAFPGTARNNAVSFSANGKIYVGLGYDGLNYLNDFWEYTPAAGLDGGTWRKVADFPNSGRAGAVAFAINNIGYVCAGNDGSNFLKDFYSFDPNDGPLGTWTQKISPGGSKRNEAVVFVIDTKAYLCTGINNGVNVDDIWEYDAITDKWTAKRRIAAVTDEDFDDKYTTIVRNSGVAFTLNGKGYITTGVNGGYTNNTWEYDPVADQWTEKTGFEGAGREGAIGFSVGNKAFTGLGKSQSFRFDDMREFKPADEYNSLD